ncbi:MAG: TIGR03936 family radical SAM-associated protein [Candidatus Omnitrophota bacterium]|mgnify:CR=1 FL=1|jgi:radical SAM-linked protein|nr:TIGR03936 family radical SAM-associated protein [Candidatus Omnitrophota bacterium]|tara:strand:- start:204 stop:503 length:300 start_codon:yes stop_codon:yes gene_type:complete
MKMDIRFSKKGDLRCISHLDIVRLFQRAVRRAGLPVKLSEGFSPRYKISFERALKLGVESENEKAWVSMQEYISEKEFQIRLNEKLPEGIEVLECRRKF